MFQIHDDTKRKILILPDSREYVWPQQMIPRRLLPQMLWESMWSTSAQSVNPKFCFRYEPNMFCCRLLRDGTYGYSKLFRQSVITQSARIEIPRVEDQMRSAQVTRNRPNFFDSWGAGILPRHYENWRVHHIDHLPLIQMTIAPVKPPRFRCIPEIMDSVAGATPRTTFYAEMFNFSTVLPAEEAHAPMPGLAQHPPPQPDSADAESDDDDSD